jgi:hypothetical protein
VSELCPQLASVIDEVCVIRSMYTFNPTHTPARSLIHSGSILANRPSLGAWVSYGLGSENENLPSFVVLAEGGGGGGSLWRAGFLPAEHQGIAFNDSETEPEKMIADLRNTRLTPQVQRRQLDALQAMNEGFSTSFGPDEFLEGRIKSMEAAYRMQFEAMDVFDTRKESEATRAEYGDSPFANGCLTARRLVEAGVRYIHVYHGQGQVWDDHKDIEKNLKERCPEMDRAAAALIRDLKRRGLLDETLVVWGGEFGRTPVSESGSGRDHNPYGFTMWMAGGGIKGGLAYGMTDEFGFKAVENRVSIHDLHATILGQLGIDHTRLTYRYAGRDFRLTDVHGEIIRDILILTRSAPLRTVPGAQATGRPSFHDLGAPYIRESSPSGDGARSASDGSRTSPRWGTNMFPNSLAAAPSRRPRIRTDCPRELRRRELSGRRRVPSDPHHNV